MYEGFDWNVLSKRHAELIAEAEEWRRAQGASVRRGGTIRRLMGRLGWRRG